MIWQSNTLTDNKINLHQRFIKPLTKRKVICRVASVFSFHQPNPFVECLMKMQVAVILYVYIPFHHFIKIASDVCVICHTVFWRTCRQSQER